MRFLTINLKCLSAREKRKAQFKPKEALKRTKEMALRKSLSWICFLRGKSEFANLPLSLSLSIFVSLCPLTNTHTHALLGKETQHTDTHTKPSSLYQYLRTPLYFAITYTLRISSTLSLTLSLYLSLSLSSSLSADILCTAKYMQINLNKLN